MKAYINLKVCKQVSCILWCYFQSDFQPYFKTPVCGAPFSYIINLKLEDNVKLILWPNFYQMYGKCYTHQVKISMLWKSRQLFFKKILWVFSFLHVEKRIFLFLNLKCWQTCIWHSLNDQIFLDEYYMCHRPYQRH